MNLNRRRQLIDRLSLSLIVLLSLVFAAVMRAEGTSDRVKPASVREVIIVFKTHFDIGYTDMASNVVQRYRTTMIDQALQVAEQNRSLPPEQQFAWTIPGWPMKKILEDGPGQTPQRRQNVLRSFHEGRFVVHALPFTTHTELLEIEDLVRGLGFSSRLSRENGKSLPRDAKMTDVPSHSWILPTLLKAAGVDFLHLGCNPASSSPAIPSLFWWEGPDGSRLLTMYSAGSYGAGPIPPPDWPHETWLAMVMTGDNHGPPRPEEVTRVLEEVKQKLPGTKARVGRISDFYDALMAEKPELPVVRGDMSDTWIYGPMANPDGMSVARRVRPAIAAAELLGSELQAWGANFLSVRTSIAEAYEQSLLYGEHTWGGAFTWIYGQYRLSYGEDWRKERRQGKFQRIEASWDEHSAYIANAQNIIAPLLRSELEVLAQAINVPGQRVVVFNPLPWSRSGIVTVKLKGGLGRITETGTGKPVVTALAGEDAIAFLATDIPSCGYKTFTLLTAPTEEPEQTGALQTNSTLETGFFRLVLNPKRGVVQSLIDKRTQREWVDAGAPQGFGQYLYERFDRDHVQAFVKAYVKIDVDWGINELGKPSLPPASQTPCRAATPERFQVRYEQTPLTVSAVMDAPAGNVPHAVTARWTLYHDQPWVDFELTVQDKPLDPWPEAGWICLPFKLDDPAFRLARLGSIVDPAKDIVAGCNFHQFALNGGMTISDPTGQGVGLCPLDSPLVSLGEPGCWKYSKNFTPRKPRVFVNLFNNQWSTNFRLWNSGTWTSRVRLWSVDQPDPEKNLVTPSEESRSPLLTAIAEGDAGKLPATQPGLQISPRGVKVTALGPNPDGEGLILRLWELAGRSGECKVQLPLDLGIRSAQPVDLRGRPTGKPISVTAGRFQVSVRGFAPASFTLHP